MKYKICFLLQSNVAGGAERVMTSIANEMINRNIDVNMIIFDDNSDFYSISNSVKVERIRTTIKSKFKKIKLVDKTLKSMKPDCVISFLPLSNYIGIFCCKKNNIPIIISERNDPNCYSLFNKFLMRLIYKKSNGIVCQSNYVKNICDKKYKKSKVVVIRNPITQNQIGEFKDNKEKKILSVGRLIPQKNHELLIKAFSKIDAKYNDYKLYIYGSGILKDYLNNLIKELNMCDRIFLMGNEKEVLKQQNDSELFILSSNFEGYPNVLIEAMCNGIPSISSDFKTGCAREVINVGQNGFLFAVNNENDLIDKINEALSDKTRLCKIAKESLKTYESNKIEKIVDEWLEFIDKICR